LFCSLFWKSRCKTFAILVFLFIIYCFSDAAAGLFYSGVFLNQIFCYVYGVHCLSSLYYSLFLFLLFVFVIYQFRLSLLDDIPKRLGFFSLFFQPACEQGLAGVSKILGFFP